MATSIDNNKEKAITSLPVLAFDPDGFVLLTDENGKTGMSTGAELVAAVQYQVENSGALPALIAEAEEIYNNTVDEAETIRDLVTRDIEVLYTDLAEDHKTYVNTSLANKTYFLFKNSTSKYLTAGTDYTVTPSGGFVLATAVASDEKLIVSGSNVLQDRTEIDYSIKRLKSKPLDYYYGPYNTIAEALAGVPNIIVDGIAFRKGQVVGINTAYGLVEYWWKDGVTDADLIRRTTTKITNDIFPLSGFYNNSGVFTASANWRSLLMDVKGGQIEFFVNSNTGANTYSFFTSNMTYISGGTGTGSVTAIVTVPTNAAYVGISTLAVNVATSRIDYTTTTPVALEGVFNKVKALAESGYLQTEVPKTLKQVETNAKFSDINNTNFPNDGFYTPAGVYNSSSSFKSVTILVTQGSITYNLYSTSGGGGAALITFFNASNAKISSVDATGSLGYKTGTVAVPAGTASAVLSTHTGGIPGASYTYQVPTGDFLASITNKLDTKADKPSEVILTVSKTGTPSATVFNTIGAAITAWQPGYKVQVFDGVYSEISLAFPKGFWIEGIGSVEIRGYLPVTSTTVDVDAKSTIDIPDGVTMKNIWVTAQNMRYPVHCDFGTTGQNFLFENCRFTHYGNYEIFKYRTDNSIASPNDAASVWRATSAFGMGSQAGCHLIFNDCYFQSTSRAFSTHNNTNYNLTAGASVVECNTCEMFSLGRDRDNSLMNFATPVFVESLASKTPDILTLNNCKINGFIVFKSTSADWREFTIDVRGGGNTSHLMQVRNVMGSGKLITDEITKITAYVIRVKSASASPITVSGNLVAGLLGNYKLLTGGTGLNSWVKGQVNHVEAFGNVNTYVGTKSITFVSGSDTKTLNLTASYTTGTQLVNDMNAQFGASSFVAELYWPGYDWYPKFTNEVDNFYNSGTTAILRGRAVKLNGFRKIAPMTSADAASAFYGIAVQDIPAGQSGDVKFKGYMLRIWVDGLFSTTLADNDLIKVNSDGTLSKSVDGTGVIVSKCISNENIHINLP